MYTISNIDMKNILEIIESNSNFLSVLSALFAIISSIFALVMILIKTTKYILDFILKKKLNKNQYDDFGYIIDNMTKNSLKYYIPTRCQDINPCNTEDFDLDIKSPSLVLESYLMKNNFEKNNHQYYLILGDSGMGKSTFLYHLFFSYYKKFFRKYEIKFIPLYDNKIFHKINEIKKKHNTILLLDGLDENEEVYNNYESFIETLLKETMEFHTIILTCRTQFFSNEQKEPKYASFFSVNTNNKKINIEKKYISPLSKKEINYYLRKKYNIIFQRKKLKHAKRLIGNCPNLMVRPLLLSYIDDLIINTSKKYYCAYEIYEEMVKKWIDREKTDNDILYMFSQKISEYMFFHNTIFITQAEINTLCKEYFLDLPDIDAQSRSLLNRNSDGIYKFAHKSIMEYFLAKKALEDSDFRKTITQTQFCGLEMVKLFLKEMCALELKTLIEKKSSKIENLHFYYIQLYDSDFSKKQFLNCVFNGCDFSGSDLSYTKFFNVKFNMTIFNDTDLNHSNLSDLILDYSNMSKAKLNYACLKQTSLKGVNLGDASMVGSDLSYTDFSNANLSNASLICANLNNAILSGANLSGAILKGARLKCANLSGANLSGADLSYADLSGANLRHTNLSLANLLDAVLIDTHIDNATLFR